MPIHKGQFFYFAFPDYQSALVEYKENNSSSRFWLANTITEGRLFYKDWFHLKEHQDIYTDNNPDIPFIEITAFAGWHYIEAPSELNILFFNFSEKASFTIFIYKNKQLIETLVLDFQESRQLTVRFTVRTPGMYSFSYTSDAGEIQILQFKAFQHSNLETNQYSEESAACFSKPPLQKTETSVTQEELYFSLKDALPEEALKNINFFNFFTETERGIAQLLNTILFLPKKDEIKFIENLFEDNFDFALQIFEKLFPFDLIFYIKNNLWQNFLFLLSEEEKQLLKISIPEKFFPLFQDFLSSVPDRNQTVSLKELEEFKIHAASKARALMQQKFGIKIRISEKKQISYRVSSAPVSYKLYGSLITDSDLSPSEKELFFLHNLWYSQTKFCSLITVSPSEIFLQAAENIKSLQIVCDEFELAKESVFNFYNIQKNEIFAVPYRESQVRLILGIAAEDGSFKEMLFDIKIFPNGKNYIFFDEQSPETESFPIKLMTSNTPALCMISLLDSAYLSASNQILKLEKTDEELKLHKASYSGFCLFLIDLQTQTASFERTFLSSADHLKPVRPAVFPLSLINIVQSEYPNPSPSLNAIYEFLFQEFILYYTDSTNPLLIARFLNILFHLFFTEKKAQYKYFLMFYLEKLMDLLSDITLTKREKIKILFAMRHYYYNGSPFYSADIKFIFDTLKISSVNTANPSLEFLLYKLLFTKTEGKEHKDFRRKLKSGIYKEKDFSMIIMALSAYDSKDKKFLKQFLRPEHSYDSLHFFGDFEALLHLYLTADIPFHFTLSEAYLYPSSVHPLFPVFDNLNQFTVTYEKKQQIYDISIKTDLSYCEAVMFLDEYTLSSEKGRHNPQRYTFHKQIIIPVIKFTEKKQKITIILFQKNNESNFYKTELELL